MIKILTTIGIVVIALIFLSWGYIAYSARELSPQALAARELPNVVRTIEDTQTYADKNAEAKKKREQLLACLNDNECEPFTTGTTPAR